jgi:hypothetical protein
MAQLGIEQPYVERTFESVSWEAIVPPSGATLERNVREFLKFLQKAAHGGVLTMAARCSRVTAT